MENNTENEEGYTKLMEAVINEDLKKTKSLLQAGAFVDEELEDGVTALLLACTFGSFEIVKILVEHGANVNHTDKEGITSLMFAAGEGYFPIVTYLVSKGVDLQLKDNNGKTAVNHAFDSKYFDIAKFLVAQGTNTNSLIQKNLPGKPMIYLPLGHSSEETNVSRFYKVPDTSILVTFEKCGLVTKVGNEGINEIIQNALQRPIDDFIQIYRNPVANKEYIQKIVYKDIFIKTPGDSLPNIDYTLLSIFNHIDKNNKTKFFTYSGLIPFERIYFPDYHNELMEWDSDFDLSFFNKFLPNLFKYSVYPTKKQIYEYFKDEQTIKQNLIRDMPRLIPKEKRGDMNSIIIGQDISWEKIVKYLKQLPLFNISIKSLMDRFPGIYYHSSCRGSFQSETNIQSTNVRRTRAKSQNEHNFRTSVKGGKRKYKTIKKR